MKKLKTFITVLLTLAGLAVPRASACTSAIIGAELNPSGRPILWKHRDTSAIDNKVERIPANGDDMGYVALFNAGDKALKEAWIGMNDAGFAIMNTASYNIKDDRVPNKQMDKEGIVMTKALKTCRTVDDFARLLETYPKPMGVEANFGVIDALGNGAYFETNNRVYKRYDLKDAPDHMLVRANYSHSGRRDEGYGYIREANAECLLGPYAAQGAVTPEVLTEEVSRSFYHDLNKRDYSEGPDRWVVDQDFIPRFKSTATVAIEGCRPVESIDYVTPGFVADEYIMWTGLGYPPVSEIRAVRNREGGVDADLRGTMDNGHSPLCEEAKRKRREVFGIHRDNGDRYIDMPLLYNEEGTGYAQQMRRLNHVTYQREAAVRDGKNVR